MSQEWPTEAKELFPTRLKQCLCPPACFTAHGIRKLSLMEWNWSNLGENPSVAAVWLLFTCSEKGEQSSNKLIINLNWTRPYHGYTLHLDWLGEALRMANREVWEVLGGKHQEPGSRRACAAPD